MVTKAELIAKIEKLERELSAAKAINAAIANRMYKVGHYSEASNCVALPLTREEKYAVEDFASNIASELAGEGTVTSENKDMEDGIVTFQLVTEWKHEAILPRFAGLLISYSYSRINGTYVEEVHGLLKVSAK